MPIVIANPSIPVTYSSVIIGTTSATVMGYWSGDAEVGLTMTDLSGNGYDLTRHVDSSSITGQVNEAIGFNGGISKQASGSGFSIPAGTFVTNGWSAEAWVNPGTFNYGIYWPMPYAFHSGNSSNIAMEIAQPNFLSSDPFRIQVNNGGVVATTGNIGSLTGWQHIAVTWNPTGTLGKIYLNGSEVLSSIVGLSGNTTFDSIAIGGKQANFAFNGGVDECVLYDGVLSGADVLAHYNAGIA